MDGPSQVYTSTGRRVDEYTTRLLNKVWTISDTGIDLPPAWTPNDGSLRDVSNASSPGTLEIPLLR